MTVQTKIPEPLHERASEVKEERDFSSIGDALRFMCREGGYDV